MTKQFKKQEKVLILNDPAEILHDRDIRHPMPMSMRASA